MTPYHFFYVYILQSVNKTSELYVGMTANLRKRLVEHNARMSSSTKRYKPWQLIYYEAFSDRTLATNREFRLKNNGNSMLELKKRIGIRELVKSGKGYDSLQMRGITLLISVILTAVVLSVALALLDITYKQVLLASSAKQSQYAFYNADAALECALYWDQKTDAFDYTATSYLSSGIICTNNTGNQQTIVITPSSYAGPPANSSTQVGSVRTTVFSIPCTGGGAQAMVTIVKDSSGATDIFANGYNSCVASDPRRIERGLKINY